MCNYSTCIFIGYFQSDYTLRQSKIITLKRRGVLTMQKLNVALNIPIPEDLVLISKVEFEDLQKESLQGVWWSMKDLEKRLNKKHGWIKDNILYQTRYKEMLDVKNGGFVFYPESQGQNWSFHAVKMTDFLDRYFTEIYRNVQL